MELSKLHLNTVYDNTCWLSFIQPALDLILLCLCTAYLIHTALNAAVIKLRGVIVTTFLFRCWSQSSVQCGDGVKQDETNEDHHQWHDIQSWELRKNRWGEKGLKKVSKVIKCILFLFNIDGLVVENKIFKGMQKKYCELTRSNYYFFKWGRSKHKQGT